jgi:hypothetical protein
MQPKSQVKKINDPAGFSKEAYLTRSFSMRKGRVKHNYQGTIYE